MTNIVTANLAKSRFYRCPPLYQYNYGMVLRITGIELPTAYEVDFANDISGQSITQIGGADGVSIPSQFFQPGQAIYCWLRVHPTQNSGITTATIVIPISPRATITDEEPTPEEQSAIDQTIAALNRAVEQTAQDVTDAQTAATAAQTAQTAAKAAQTAAETAAQQAADVQSDVFAARDAAIAAKTAAETAQAQAGQSAQSASESASSAATEAENAAESAQTAMTAQASAETAKSGAETAAGGAQTAATDAQHERESAMLAAGAAGSAMLNAQTAQTAAETAATAAQQSATAAAQSATAANTAKTDAQTAKTGAETARSGAETAQAAAEAALENYDEMEQSVSELKSNVGDIEDAITKEVKSKNLLDTSKLTVGRLSSSGGVDPNMTGYSTSDYIPVEAGKTYVFGNESHTTPGSLALMGYSGYGFYDTEKVWIANSRVWDNNGKVTLLIQPTVDGFVRVSGGGSSFTATTASFIVQEGTTLDGWEAYFEPYTDVIALTTDDIAEDFGQSTEKVISQKAITDAIGGVPNVTGRASLINLYDKTLAVNGKYINNGSVVTYADWAYTGLIPVKPNTQYNISNLTDAPLTGATVVYAFRSDKSFIGTISKVSYVYSYLLGFITDSETYYIAQNYSKAGHTQEEFEETFDTVMLCYGTQRPSAYAPYNEETVLLSGKLDNSYFNPNVFSGKRWLALGTSITWYDSKAYSAGVHTGEICRGYVGNVARRKALLITNEGISGSTLANVSSSSLINRYQNLDWANADIATIEYGVNDFGHAVAIGTADDAPGTDTFAACLKTVIEYALTQNPKLCLVICTEPDVRGNTQNTGGHYLKEYTDVTLEIAKQYRLPVCDWYYHCGINAVTKGNATTDLLTADGTHPNDAGHLRMGAMLNQVFDSLIC